uniref:Uncharacterized protein n=1 Tax=Arion vulgaris TaxID=1028688 RepID=A0A0B7AV60_9EUPU
MLLDEDCIHYSYHYLYILILKQFLLLISTCLTFNMYAPLVVEDCVSGLRSTITSAPCFDVL